MKLNSLLVSVYLVTVAVVTTGLALTNESPVVATVLNQNITAADIGLQYDANHKPMIPAITPSMSSQRNPVDDLRASIFSKVIRDYIEQNKLEVTAAEIREFQEYQVRFMAQDRINRQKSLAELEKKLQDPTLDSKAKEQAEKYHATLLSLASYDKQRDEKSAKSSAEAGQGIAMLWTTGWKASKSIYEKYGGAVAITKFGLDPVGANKCLLEDYEKQGKLTIHDEQLKRALWERLSLPPRLIAKPGEIDFTPYWKKPLPVSQE